MRSGTPQHNRFDNLLNRELNSRRTIVLCSRYHRYIGTGGLQLARELPEKRRPTKVSALIIGSTGAIGGRSTNLKVDLGLHCGAVGTGRSATRASGCVRTKQFTNTQRETP